MRYPRVIQTRWAMLACLDTDAETTDRIGACTLLRHDPYTPRHLRWLPALCVVCALGIALPAQGQSTYTEQRQKEVAWDMEMWSIARRYPGYVTTSQGSDSRASTGPISAPTIKMVSFRELFGLPEREKLTPLQKGIRAYESGEVGEAISFLEEAAQEDSPDRGDAQLRLAQIYDGRTYRSDLQSARERTISWYRLAAQSGETVAYWRLAQLLDLEGQGAEAIEWYHEAARAGGDTPSLLRRIGEILFRGRGIARDEDRARRSLESAALLGDPVAESYVARMAEGDLLLDLKHDAVGPFSAEGLAIVAEEGKWGFVDTTGHVVIPLRFDQADAFHEGHAVVNEGGWRLPLRPRDAIQGGRWYVIDTQGEEVRALPYDFVSGFSGGLAVVNRGGTLGDYGSPEGGVWGYIDWHGVEVVEVRYERAFAFRGGCARAFSEESGALCFDQQGQLDHQVSWSASDTTYVAVRDGQYGLRHVDGRELLPYGQYTHIGPFVAGEARVNVGGTLSSYGPQGGKWGTIDANGQILVEPIFDSLTRGPDGNLEGRYFSTQDVVDDFGRGGTARFTAGIRIGAFASSGKWGVMNEQGEEVVPPRYDYLDIVGGRATRFNIGGTFTRETNQAEKAGGKWGFIDRSGREIVPAIYDAAYSFPYDGLARVNRGGTFRDGRSYDGLIIEGRDGRSVVGRFYGGTWAYIDSTGSERIGPLELDWVDDYAHGLAVAVRDGKYGFINEDGEFVIPPVYSGAVGFGFGYEDEPGPAAVRSGSGPDAKWGFIDVSGKLIIPFRFDTPRDDPSGYRFYAGRCYVQLDGTTVLIDSKGRILE